MPLATLPAQNRYKPIFSPLCSNDHREAHLAVSYLHLFPEVLALRYGFTSAFQQQLKEVEGCHRFAEVTPTKNHKYSTPNRLTTLERSRSRTKKIQRVVRRAKLGQK